MDTNLLTRPLAPSPSPLVVVDKVRQLYPKGSGENLLVLDGISLTNTITPSGLGRTKEEQVSNLVGILDAGFIPEDDCIVEPQN